MFVINCSHPGPCISCFPINFSKIILLSLKVEKQADKNFTDKCITNVIQTIDRHKFTCPNVMSKYSENELINWNLVMRGSVWQREEKRNKIKTGNFPVLSKCMISHYQLKPNLKLQILWHKFLEFPFIHRYFYYLKFHLSI